MPGFPLAAFGAGLGQFAEYQQKQQAAQQRQQLLGLEMLRFRQELQDRQRKEQAASALLGGFRGMGDQGGGTGQPDLSGFATPAFGGSPMLDAPDASGAFSVSPPSPRSPLAPGVGGGIRSATDPWLSGGPPINPAALDRTPSSFPSAATPPAMAGSPQTAAQRAQPGWQAPPEPTAGSLALPSGAPPARGGFTPPSTAIAGIQQDDPIRQMGRQTLQAAAPSIPPQVYGKMSTAALVAAIDKANPDADPVAKVLAIEMGQKLLAPDQRMQWELFKQQHDDKFKLMLEERHDARQERSLASSDARQATALEAAERRQDKSLEAIAGRQERGIEAKVAAAGDARLAPEAVSTMADQYLAGDRTVMQNLGRGAQGAQNIVALRAEIAKKMAERGMSGADMATKMAEFEGLKAGERTLTQRTANIGMRVAEAKKFAPLALAASEKVDRTQFPTLNSLLLAAERGTGGEDVVRLSVATMSLLNAYAAAVTPTGTPTEGAQSRAHELLDKAWSQGQYRAAINQLMLEMEAASKSPGIVREEFRRGADPARSADAPAAAPVVAPPVTPEQPPQGKVIKLDAAGNVIP